MDLCRRELVDTAWKQNVDRGDRRSAGPPGGVAAPVRPAGCLPWGLEALVRWEAPRLARFVALYQQLRQLPRRVRRLLQRKLVLSLAEVALLLALGQGVGQAATITVSARSGCTLVDAITAANTDTATGGCPAGSGTDTIVLVGSPQTLTAVNNSTYGPTGLPVVTSIITIQGNNSTVKRDSGAPEFRLLVVGPTGQLTVRDLTLHGGVASGALPAYLGGGVYNLGVLTMTNSTVSGNSASGLGGGVYNLGSLTLTSSTLSGNTATGHGGGVVNEGILTLTNSTVSGNTTSDRGGGVYNCNATLTLTNSTVSGNTATGPGGGVYNLSGPLTMTNSTVSGNTATMGPGGGVFNLSGPLLLANNTVLGNSATGPGGGVANIYGALTLTNSTVSGNTASAPGGGVFNYSGALSLANSTVSGNTANGAGGGVANIYGALTLTNSTVAGNVVSGKGGGVYNYSGTLTLTNSTVAGNTASGNGGGVYTYYGTLTLAQTLVTGNTAANGRELYNYGGFVTAANFNLFGFGSVAGTTGFTPGATDVVPSQVLSAILHSTLAFNGGPTQTLNLVSGSPAVNAIPAGCPATDQRGFVRQPSACDIGAVEFGAPAPPMVNRRVSFTQLRDTISTTQDTTGCGAGYVGKTFFLGRLTALSGALPLIALKAVVALNDNNKLQTADGGVGAQQTLPPVGAFSDGVLSAGETLDVPFVVCLKTSGRVQVGVNVLGLPQ